MHPDELMEQVNRLGERLVRDVLALVSQLPEKENGQGAAQSQEWMTALQLAEYWQLYNDKGEPTTAGIMKWAKREPEQSPLPHASMGDLFRFNRDDANQWAREEAQRRRAENERRRLKIA